MSLNKVMLIGNLGADPEVKLTDTQVKYARFNLATNETYKDTSGNVKKITTWHRIVIWRGLAEVAEKYLKKGNQVYIEGRIRNNEYTDKEGQTRYSIEIIGDELVMLGSREDSSANTPQTISAAPNATTVEQNQKVNTPESEDDLPF